MAPALLASLSIRPISISSFLCGFAALADVAKGGDGAESAWREIFLFRCLKLKPNGDLGAMH
jgi:hypothetical protein